ncbi:MAG: flagellar export chaperone FlgN [Spirochaetaceae bacterium]|jgi:uncharacterized protein YdcH (DUF465 family)|nr:flagellar export chaperone FlgN [Spirochaetaceae bacterium]
METEAQIRILQEQNEVLERLAGIHESLRKAVMNREWTDFEALLASLHQYSDHFEALEAERSRLMGDIATVYRSVARLPEEERSLITGMYRNLKRQILAIRMANESLATYLNEANIMVKSFLEAACPERKTRFYSRWGTQVAAEPRSMMVNHSL